MSLSYTKDIPSVVEVHRYLSQYGLQVLVERYVITSYIYIYIIFSTICMYSWTQSVNQNNANICKYHENQPKDTLS